MAEHRAANDFDEPTPSALSSLSLEVLQLLCEFMHYAELLAVSVCSSDLAIPSLHWTASWERAAISLLGLGPCCLHVCEANRNGQEVNAGFWRRMCRAAVELRSCCWSQTMRRKFIEVPPGQRSSISCCASGTGHVSVTFGEFVFKIGGLRRNYSTDRMMNQDPTVETCFFDLRKQRMGFLRLTRDSEQPEQRMRHAACLVRPPLFNFKQTILMLGGWNDFRMQPCTGGLRSLYLLEPLKENRQFRGRWHCLEAQGIAPASIWHHTCASFDNGRKVVVFGGNFQVDDPEYPTIARSDVPAEHVYILSFDAIAWSRVTTTGNAPRWRSLHQCILHTYFEEGRDRERLIIYGGCDGHIEVFTTPEILPPMHGFALDLDTMAWSTPQYDEDDILPAARARMAGSRVGNWLVLYGGHGPELLPVEEDVPNIMFKMNLKTLKWSTFEVLGAEVCNVGAPCATLCSNLVIGGLSVCPRGFTTPPKFEVLMLCDPEAVTEASGLATSSS